MLFKSKEMQMSELESKLDVLALGYNHLRLLRDSAGRADEYLDRVLTRGGKVLEEEFWIDLPEAIDTISLREIKAALTALVGKLALRMEEVKEEATHIATYLELPKNIDYILYELARKQKTTKNLPHK